MTSRIIIIFSILFIGSKSALSQEWQSANLGLNGGDVRVIFEKENTLFAGTGQSGLFKSLDFGETWAQSNDGLIPQFGIQNISHVSAFTTLGDTLFLGSYQHNIFFSLDNGNTWSLTPEQPSNSQITALLTVDRMIFAGTVNGLFISKDAGQTWVISTNGLPNSVNINSLSQLDSVIILGAYYGGAFFSIDNGLTWNEIESIPSDENVHGTLINGTNCYFFTNKSLYQSENGINTLSGIWTPDTHINDLDTFANKLIAATLDGVYTSLDSGTTWEKADMPEIPEILPEVYDNFSDLHVSNNKIFIGNNSFGIFSSQNGIDWNLKNTSMNGFIANSLVNDNLYIYTSGSTGLYRSKDGNGWEELMSGNFKLNQPITLGDSLFAVGTGLHLSTDHGDTWTNFPSVGISGNGQWQPQFLNSSFFFLSAGNQLFKYNSDTQIWVEIFSMETTFPINGFVKFNDTLLMSNYLELYRSIDNGQNWEKIVDGLPSSLYIRGVSHIDSVFFLQSNNDYFRSFDNGETWESLDVNWAGFGLYSSRNNFLFTKNFGYSHFSPDLGTSWIIIDEGKSFQYTSDYTEKDDFIYGGTTEGIWKAQIKDFNHSIYSINSLAVSVGDEVTIIGQNFSTDKNTNRVYINDIEAEVIESTSQTIVFQVPQGATSGSVRVSIFGRDVISEASICVKPGKPIIKDSLDNNGMLLLVSSSLENQWYFENEEIEGENEYFYYPDINGNYSVIDLGNGCQSEPSDDFLVCLNISIPSITDSTASNGEVFLISSSENGNQWYFDGEQVGVSDKIYQPLASGFYTLKVTHSSGCESSFSEAYEYIMPLGLANNQNQTRIYPNPMSQHLTLEFEDSMNKTIKIYDSSGVMKVIFSSFNRSLNIDMTSYPRGIYLLSIEQNNSVNSMKIIKE